MNAKLPDTLNLVYKLRESDEFDLFKQIKDHEGSIRIFKDNYQELIETLDFHNNPVNDQTIWKNPRQRDKIHWTLIRRIHNFLSSAISLVDHTRIHKNKINWNVTFNKAYQDKIDKEFKSWPVHNFIKDLRHFILHYKVPLIYSHRHFEKKEKLNREHKLTPITTVRFKIKDILDFDWDKKSREYLEKQGK